MRSNVESNSKENAPGHRGLSFRYRALLWLAVGIVLRLLTGSNGFLLAAVPIIMLAVVAAVGGLIVLWQRGCPSANADTAESSPAPSAFSATAEAV